MDSVKTNQEIDEERGYRKWLQYWYTRQFNEYLKLRKYPNVRMFDDELCK